MKQRVAFIATCLNLCLCIAFLSICMVTTRDQMNRQTMDHLSTLSRLSASRLDSAAFDVQEAELHELARLNGVLVTRYETNGQVEYNSRSAISHALTLSDLRSADGQKAITFLKNTEDGRPLLYAVSPLDGSGYLVLSSFATPLVNALGGMNKVLLLVLMALIVGLISLIIFQWSIARTNRLVNGVERVLEDFSEGNFDSRLTDAPGDSLYQSARFNEILARIQDRIFKQKTHNQALSTVMNHLQNGILAVDDDLNVILITPSAKQLLGITGSPEGLPIQQALKDVKIDTIFQSAMQQEGVYTNEIAVRSTAGRSHRPLRFYISPMMKDEKVVGAVAIIEDITELRRLEQVRTDFVANVSHELKTPLTSIKGFVETLQDGAISNPEMANKFLRIIMLEADRLTRLINDILSISKLESGKDEVSLQKIQLDKMAYEVADMLSIHAGEKKVTIHAQQNDEPIYVVGNPDRVEQMLINLIENGIKYNQPGGSVTVSVFASGDNVNLSVSDTGIGIKEEHQLRLFERFYRVDKGRSRSMGGTGLGLAIVKHIVRTMDGMIEVQSKYGEGTEFLITLPRAPEGDVLPRPAKRDEDEDEDFEFPF